MRYLLLAALVLTLGCTKPKYFLICSRGADVLFVQQVSDSLKALRLADALVGSELYDQCAALVVR